MLLVESTGDHLYSHTQCGPAGFGILPHILVLILLIVVASIEAQNGIGINPDSENRQTAEGKRARR